jgi:hypothetical protein
MEDSGTAGRAVGKPVFGGKALPFPLRVLPFHLRDPRIMEWLHHLSEGVTMVTEATDRTKVRNKRIEPCCSAVRLDLSREYGALSA